MKKLLDKKYIILTVLFAISMIMAFAFWNVPSNAFAEEAVTFNTENVSFLYFNEDGTYEERHVDAKVIDSSITSFKDGYLNQDWYIVKGNVTITGGLKTNGAVNIILQNASIFNVNGGIKVYYNNSLSVFAQTTDYNRMGKMHVYSWGNEAAIWGDYSNGYINIYGGNIYAYAINGAAVGAYIRQFKPYETNLVGSIVNMYNGSLTAITEGGSAAIGGAAGDKAVPPRGSWIEGQKGGNGGTFNFYHGKVFADSANGFAIGGGQGGYGDGVRVLGSEVTRWNEVKSDDGLKGILNIYDKDTTRIYVGDSKTALDKENSDSALNNGHRVAIKSTNEVRLHYQNGGIQDKVVLCDYGARTVEPEEVTLGANKVIGWYTSPECKKSQKYIFGGQMFESIDLYALWSDELLNVNFSYNDGSDVVEVQDVLPNQKATAITPLRDDATFAGWYTDADVYNSTLFDFNTPITKSITLYARWNKDYFKHDQATKSFTRQKLLQSANFRPITSDSATLNGGWYFVDGTVTLNDRLIFNGDTNLVLFSDARLTARKGIEVQGSFNIYSDTENGGGRINIAASGMEENKAGILCGDGSFSNANITVASGVGACAISGSNLTFVNCTINATATKSPNAIGCNNLTLLNGSLTAQSSDVAIAVSGTKNISTYFSVKAGDSSASVQVVTEYGGKKYVKIEEPSVLEGKEGSCLENGLLPAYKNSKNGIYYLEKTYKTAIGNFEQLVVWADSPERQLAVGHKWVSVDGNIHKCSVCELEEEHTDLFEFGDHTCNVCGGELCHHEHMKTEYVWNDDYTSCVGRYYCEDCGKAQYEENAYEIIFTFDPYSQNCQTEVLGYYHASFYYVPSADTEAKFETGESGLHFDSDEDGYCDTCHTFMAENAVTSTTTTLTSGNWIVVGNVTITNTLTVQGKVILYLFDNSVLTVKKGIILTEGNSLTVESQSSGSNKGKIVATGEANHSGIGGYAYKYTTGSTIYNAGTFIVNGGDITAKGGDNAKDIGTVIGGNHGTFIANGGKIHATVDMGDYTYSEMVGNAVGSIVASSTVWGVAVVCVVLGVGVGFGVFYLIKKRKSKKA